MRTRVKICGITNVEDLRLAVSAGADALGFNFYKPSPRYLDGAKAAELLSEVPPYVTRVGLFVNESATQVSQTAAALGLDLLQFHGDETPEYCAQFSRPYMKAIRVTPDMDLAAEIALYAAGQGILLDAYDANVYGGTGKSIDWQTLGQRLVDVDTRIILAGGLNPGNVAQAIKLIAPWAVDVSSGIEAVKGKKDREKLEQFVNAVNAA